MIKQMLNGLVAEKRPDPEVRPRAQRRSFTAAYKQRILAESDMATGSGAIGALLRREGLYSSHLTHWRQERADGIKKGLTPRARGPKPDATASAKENQLLRRQNERLTEQLRKAEIIIDVQKKVATLLGLTLAEPDPKDLL
jgi:transposase-like protein